MSEIKREIARKSIHFAGLIYIPTYIYFGKELVLAGVLVSFIFAALIEIGRKHFEFLSKIVNKIVRNYERRGVGAHIYFGGAILIITALFPRSASFVAVITSLLGDGIAGIIKKRFSKNVASFMMFLASFLALALIARCTEINLYVGFLVCLISVIVERIEKVGKYYLNDNLSVPLASAFSYCFLDLMAKQL